MVHDIRKLLIKCQVSSSISNSHNIFPCPVVMALLQAFQGQRLEVVVKLVCEQHVASLFD